MKISAVVLAKNEERTLAHCLKTLTWCDEVIVIDDYSIDKTVKIARKYGAKVYSRHMDGDFSGQRNFGLSKARNEWVLFIDADERVNEQLRSEIKRKIENKKYDGYYLFRENYFLGKEVRWGEWKRAQRFSKWGHNRLLRLGRRNKGVWVRKVHEHWDIKGKIGCLEAALVHERKSVSEVVENINLQSRLHAASNEAEKKNSNFARILVMPTAKFGMNYVIKEGFRDGVSGFVMAIMMSMHSFLAWSDLWLRKP